MNFNNIVFCLSYCNDSSTRMTAALELHEHHTIVENSIVFIQKQVWYIYIQLKSE